MYDSFGLKIENQWKENEIETYYFENADDNTYSYIHNKLSALNICWLNDYLAYHNLKEGKYVFLCNDKVILKFKIFKFHKSAPFNTFAEVFCQKKCKTITKIQLKEIKSYEIVDPK